MKRILFLFTLVLLLSQRLISQPFADLLSANYQTFSSVYTDSAAGQKNKTDDYFLNLFLPKVFKNGNTLLVRLNGETMNSTISPDSSYSCRLSSVSLPVGFKFVAKSKKWETVVIGIPKIASDFRAKPGVHDWQLGGIFLEYFVPNDKLKVKLGLYYNREAFGNYFMPLVGVDWKINSRVSIYGVLPSSYRLEFNLVKNKLYTGLGFRSATRSFSLSEKSNYDYVRYNEQQVKVFVDWFVYKKFLLFAEAGYSTSLSPLQYTFGTKDLTYVNPVFTPMKSYPVVNVGIAYRIRMDLAGSGREEAAK
jgi:hypothetical protein